MDFKFPPSSLLDDGTGPQKESETLISRAYASIKSRIISGHYPPGAKLRIEQLKSDFQVSGSTLREALTMLVADRLVTAEGQRGFRVMPVSRKDLLDLSQTRIVLETAALRQAIELGDEQWEGQLASSLHILNRAARTYPERNDTPAFEEWEDRHRAFHLSLISAAGSEWMKHFLRILYRQQHRYRHIFQAITLKHAGRNAQGEHQEIFDAVMARDADKATTLLQDHLNRTLQEWMQHFDEASVPTTSPQGKSERRRRQIDTV